MVETEVKKVSSNDEIESIILEDTDKKLEELKRKVSELIDYCNEIDIKNDKANAGEFNRILVQLAEYLKATFFRNQMYYSKSPYTRALDRQFIYIFDKKAKLNVEKIENLEEKVAEFREFCDSIGADIMGNCIYLQEEAGLEIVEIKYSRENKKKYGKIAEGINTILEELQMYVLDVIEYNNLHNSIRMQMNYHF